MSRRVMICCAVTGSADTPRKNPAVPVTPEAIARSAVDAARAKASRQELDDAETAAAQAIAAAATGEGDRAKPDDLWNMVILVRSFSKK